MNSKPARIFLCALFVLIASGISAPPVHAAPTHCYLSPDVIWFDCGIDLVEGVPVKLVGKGKAATANLDLFPEAWSGPDGQTYLCWKFDGVSPCALEYKPYGALLGKIGLTGEPFVIGSGLTFTPTTSGRLYVIANDNLPYYADNYGSYVVYQFSP